MINNNEDNPGNPSKRTQSKKSDIDHNESSALESQKKNHQQTSSKKKAVTIKDLAIEFLENESDMDKM